MSLREPLDTGTPDGSEPPTSTLEMEVLLEFDHDQTLSPEEMAHVNHQVARRVAAALHERNLFAGLLVQNAQSSWNVVRGRGADTPVYPLRVGCETFLHNLDLVARVETLCKAAGLGALGYDLAGRAYELHVEIAYLPERPMDGARGPGLDDPASSYRLGYGSEARQIEEEALELAAEMAGEGEA